PSIAGLTPSPPKPRSGRRATGAAPNWAEKPNPPAALTLRSHPKSIPFCREVTVRRSVRGPAGQGVRSPHLRARILLANIAMFFLLSARRFCSQIPRISERLQHASGGGGDLTRDSVRVGNENIPRRIFHMTGVKYVRPDCVSLSIERVEGLLQTFFGRFPRV